jgi:hypothetical protein
MSSWERARYIPWDRIPQTGTNLEEQKERIFRELQRETIEDEFLQQDRHSEQPVVTGKQGTDSAKPFTSNKVPYSNMELLRQAAFGGCLGTITGAVFGFMDGMRTAQESSVLQNASNVAKGRYLMQGTTRSATLFGVFFGGFHILKYGLKVTLDPGDVGEIGVAGAASVGTLFARPAWRPNIPYALMLVAMDGFNLYMRKSS